MTNDEYATKAVRELLQHALEGLAEEFKMLALLMLVKR